MTVKLIKYLSKFIRPKDLKFGDCCIALNESAPNYPGDWVQDNINNLFRVSGHKVICSNPSNSKYFVHITNDPILNKSIGSLFVNRMFILLEANTASEYYHYIIQEKAGYFNFCKYNFNNYVEIPVFLYRKPSI